MAGAMAGTIARARVALTRSSAALRFRLALAMATPWLTVRTAAMFARRGGPLRFQARLCLRNCTTGAVAGLPDTKAMM